MSERPWETHDRLCSSRRPTIAFPNSACSGCRAVAQAQRDERERIRAGVTGLTWFDPAYDIEQGVLAVIDGGAEKPPVLATKHNHPKNLVATKRGVCGRCDAESDLKENK